MFNDFQCDLESFDCSTRNVNVLKIRRLVSKRWSLFTRQRLSLSDPGYLDWLFYALFLKKTRWREGVKGISIDFILWDGADFVWRFCLTACWTWLCGVLLLPILAAYVSQACIDFAWYWYCFTSFWDNYVTWHLTLVRVVRICFFTSSHLGWRCSNLAEFGERDCSLVCLGRLYHALFPVSHSFLWILHFCWGSLVLKLGF